MPALFSDKKPVVSASEAFFLPDLCNAQSQLVLIILAELLALVVTGLQRGFLPMDWLYFSLVSLFCLLIFLSAALLLCVLRERLSRMPLFFAATGSYLLVLALVLIYSLAAQWLLALTTLMPLDFDVEQLFLNFFVGAVVAGIGLRYLYLTWQLRLREQSEMVAHIQALQSRIQPHFLFNSLNTIASLIDDSPQDAERAVENLAALFRANLQDSRVFSDWGSERDVCERYLSIEGMRLGDRLHVSWQAQNMPETTPILSLSLQPLLENAVLHGIQKLPSGGSIVITASNDGAECCITVENPVAPDVAAEPGNRLACENLRHRLNSVYGERGKLLLSEKRGHFCVEMRFPSTPER